MTLIEQLRKNQIEFPDKAAVIHKEVTLSNGDLARQVNSWLLF